MKILESETEQSIRNQLTQNKGTIIQCSCCQRYKTRERFYVKVPEALDRMYKQTAIVELEICGKCKGR